MGEGVNEPVPSWDVLFALVVAEHFGDAHRVSDVGILRRAENILLALVKCCYDFSAEAACVPPGGIAWVAFLESEAVERRIYHFAEKLNRQAKTVGNQRVVY